MIENAIKLCALATLAWACSASPPGAAGSASASPPISPSASATPAPASPAPGAPAALPELRVATSGDYAPFSTRDAAGAPSGFDVEIAKSLASELGFALRWVPFRWPELSAKVEAGDLDVAMGGVTWQPSRAVLGYMTRAVARGGPCLLGDATAARVAVNRGGILEAWARKNLAQRELVTVDDNQSLPELLAAGRVGAIVTDSFERRAFERPGWASRCEPALTRKVYWVAPGHRELGERIDEWLRENTARVQAAQRRWFGEEQRLDATTHLVDLLARRLAFMPLVAAKKAEQNLPIEDLPREREVIDAAAQSAARLGLPAAPVRELFALQITLSKAVQQRQAEPSALDLGRQIRPALTDLGDRILEALAQARTEHRLEALAPADLELLSPWLDASERQRLLEQLRAVASG